MKNLENEEFLLLYVGLPRTALAAELSDAGHDLPAVVALLHVDPRRWGLPTLGADAVLHGHLGATVHTVPILLSEGEVEIAGHQVLCLCCHPEGAEFWARGQRRAHSGLVLGHRDRANKATQRR